jgi:hypothetical protein
VITSEKPHDVWTAYFNSVEAVSTQQLQAVTSLDLNGSVNSSWEEVEAPSIQKFERARDNPKHLKLGPLLVAAVEVSPSRLVEDFQKICKLNSLPGNVVGHEDTHGNLWLEHNLSWLESHKWHLHDCISGISVTWSGLCENKVAVNEAISKLQSGL